MNQQKRNQLTSQEQDNLNSVVAEIEKRNTPHSKQMGMEQFKEEIEKAKKGYEVKSISEKISIVINELEQERKKPPAIEVREKEVVKLEPKCAKCNQKAYTSKLGQLKYITYGALAYSIIITIIGIIKNNLVKADFKTFLGSSWSFIQGVFKNANKGFTELSNKVDNNVLQMIIHIGLWVLIAGVVIFGLYKLVSELKYKTWKFWNVGAVGMVLLDLILIVYLSEPIKNLTKLNLFIFALLFYAWYIIIRIIINFIKSRN